MESSNFNANGQVVYVDPNWVSGETCVFNIHNLILRAHAKKELSKIRTSFISHLEKEGFVITYNKEDITDDTISLIMDNQAICDDSVDLGEYKKKFDQRMFEAGGSKLNYPYSLSMEEYFERPFYPAVFKNESTNGGVDKFLIETPEQVEVIKKFYADFMPNKEYAAAFSCSIFQELIETPTDDKTYMRVLMAASGDLMGASLKYSRVGMQSRESVGLFEKYFWDENSEYFLNCTGMFNYYSCGGNISFSQPKYSRENRSILLAHGIDPDNVVVPEEVLEVASLIARKCNRELGIMCGIDFILSKRDDKWYYLEIQAFPAIDEWASTKGIRKIKVNSVDDYINCCKIELEARYEALMLCMRKKISCKESSDFSLHNVHCLKKK